MNHTHPTADNPALCAALRRLVTTHKLLTWSEAERLAAILDLPSDALRPS